MPVHCRIVGAEASCSSARSEEVPRRLLGQETGMMVLVVLSNLGRNIVDENRKCECEWLYVLVSQRGLALGPQVVNFRH